MRICVVGAGYVGLVSAACFSEIGFNVEVVDIDEAKIDQLKNGIIPIYEPGLENVVVNAIRSGKLTFSTCVKTAASLADVLMIAVGTPSKDNSDEADLSYVVKVVDDVSVTLSKDRYMAIVTKSTVPVTTGEYIKQRIAFLRSDLQIGRHYDVVSNPEFLREGSAINDFMHPDRIVIGIDKNSKKATELMQKLYAPLESASSPVLFTDIETSELIKYASNSFLATKVAFINELSNLCEQIGANIDTLAYGMGLDSRIGSKFLRAGPGYGGSCFPKDTRALIHTAEKYGVDLSIVKAGVESNEQRKNNMAQRIYRRLNSDDTGVNGKVVAVLGITFKAGTDDVRESPSIVIINELIKKGLIVRVYDPMYSREDIKLPEELSSDRIIKTSSIYDAARGAEAIAILTEWNEFRVLDFSKLKEVMSCKGKPIIFDMRNVLKDDRLKEFEYRAIGRRQN